jgi:trigger factor
VKVEYIEETTVRKALAFEIEPEVVEKEIEQRAREYARKVKLPGFRPGKIPAEVIRQRFRQQVLEDAAEAIVNRVVFDELEGRGLRPLASPKVQDLHIDENQPMTFRAVFETLPFVEVPEYRGVEVKARQATVAEDDVDKEVDGIREEAARYEAIEGRPARAGDYVLADVERRTADEPEPSRDENVLIEVGAESNFAELNEALAGAVGGETREVTLVREDAKAPLGARTIRYKIDVKGVKEKVVPAADDEFAKDLGEFGSLGELRDHVRARLLATREREADRAAKHAIVERLVEQATVEVPEALVERHLDARMESVVRDLAYQGVDPRQAKVDWKAFREGQREGALKAAKAEMLLDEIARRENVEALPAEVEAELARYAERVRKPLEQVKRQMEKEGALSAVSARIREEKTLDLLKANARLIFEQ